MMLLSLEISKPIINRYNGFLDISDGTSMAGKPGFYGDPQHVKKVLFVLLLFISYVSYADCLQGANGEVFCGAGDCDVSDPGIVSCSIYRDGGASVNGQGRVQCGRGLCLQDSAGRVFCSVEEDGGAAVNLSGLVKCSGGCEPGSESMCESVRGL